MTTNEHALPWPVQAACLSDVGRVRRQNEDQCLVALERKLFIVSDEVGDHLAGEVASRTVEEKDRQAENGRSGDEGEKRSLHQHLVHSEKLSRFYNPLRGYRAIIVPISGLAALRLNSRSSFNSRWGSFRDVPSG